MAIRTGLASAARCAALPASRAFVAVESCMNDLQLGFAGATAHACRKGGTIAPWRPGATGISISGLGAGKRPGAMAPVPPARHHLVMRSRETCWPIFMKAFSRAAVLRAMKKFDGLEAQRRNMSRTAASLSL